MEYGLRGLTKLSHAHGVWVLILVLMEYGLRVLWVLTVSQAGLS